MQMYKTGFQTKTSNMVLSCMKHAFLTIPEVFCVACININKRNRDKFRNPCKAAKEQKTGTILIISPASTKRNGCF